MAALVRRDNGSVGDVRIALTNMGPTPVRATTTENAILAGEEDPAAHLADGTEPITDTSATAEFRAHLARVVGRRALEEAMAR